MDCYDCKYADFDYEEYYGGYKQKIVVGCKAPSIEDMPEWCEERKEHADSD